MHYLNGFVPDVECKECDGNGFVMKRQPRLGRGLYEVDCEACCGHGWRPMNDEEQSDAAEAAYERFCEDFYGGSSPVTLDEQHRAAWLQKREARK